MSYFKKEKLKHVCTIHSTFKGHSRVSHAVHREILNNKEQLAVNCARREEVFPKEVAMRH